ncbi:manganese ABC transporter substrate-binding protein [Exiguobacterium indicum]|uniref:Manganese ABC transporter substrate-binding protein n=1 Tax=Exiguobacterium indicum TaxID=296995 RepID=A0A0V8GHQ6_9BACL|nr:metal ABC transporter substrate-binding protein [Exiguobacterium enclense]KSU49824.1 manganese ABC transporter substrate-binding protein [Exiguobacterium enclense]SDB84982.1 iron/zinc/copper transport system substrate-binding protein [Exiguobacterium enclense]
MKVKLFLFVLLSTVLLAACSTPAEDNGKLKVVATYSILADLAREVGGEHVDVHSMVKIGANPHEYDPLPADVQAMADADVVFYNGLNLEAGGAWFDKLRATTGKDSSDAPVYRLSKGVEPKYLTTKGKESETDPHAWLDVSNGIRYVENVKQALIKEDPKHKADYEKNTDAYIEKLQTLDQEAKQQFAAIPKAERHLVTSEGAFKYFGTAYDVKADYIWEINSDDQGTPAQVRRIVDTIKEQDIPVLFVETSVDRRSMETVSRETGVPIGGTLFTDSLGAPGKDGDTYYSMMQANIETITEALAK